MPHPSLFMLMYREWIQGSKVSSVERTFFVFGLIDMLIVILPPCGGFENEGHMERGKTKHREKVTSNNIIVAPE